MTGPFGEFARFCVVGAGSALAGFAALFLLADVIGLHYMLAFVISFVLVNAAAFLAAGSFAFRAGGSAGRAGLLRYYLISAGSLAVNSLALALLVEVLGLWYLLAAAFLALANAPVNFLLHRRWTFRLGCDWPPDT